MTVKEFIERHFRHFNAATLLDAATDEPFVPTPRGARTLTLAR